jgi:hypothetical protein
MVVMAVSMALALNARLCLGYFSIQITMQGLLYRTRCARNGLDAVLLKKANRPVPHAAGQHHVNPMAVNEGRYLSGPVAVVKGIFYNLDGYNCVLFYLGDDKVGAAAKVIANGTF